jgi:AcrR family transcriptional regulator
MRADARRNYDLLVAAAGAAFTEHGADASLEDIARRAGVGIGTLYRHFPTREALLAKVLDQGAAGIIARAHELSTVAPPVAALTAWLEAMIGYLTTYRGLSESLAASMVGAGTELDCSCQAITAAGSTLLARAQRVGELRSDVDICDLMLGANAAAWAAERAKEPAAARRLLNLMLDGLRTARGQAPPRGQAARRPATSPSRADDRSGRPKRAVPAAKSRRR